MLVFSKAQMRLPAYAFEFAEGNLESGVRRLLPPAIPSTGPSAGALRNTVVIVVILACAAGGAMHWAVQAITRLP